MKKILQLSFTAFLMLSLFAACSSDDNPSEPTLSIDLNTAIPFSAAATESYTITVTTNQDEWKVVSDQTWCKVAKSGNKFTVTATPNQSTTAPPAATITVSAGTAQPLTIAVTQSGVGASLSVSPNTPLTFAAIAAESYTISVETNQEAWDAVSDKDWCIVTKGDGKFVVTATQNLIQEALTATITVSAGQAANISIAVTQAAATPPVGAEDKGKTIWEDTHWRMYQLKGSPKSVITEHSELIEFNTKGLVTYDGSSEKGTWYYRYEYDGNGRIVKRTDKESADDITVMEYTYGIHTKYVPLGMDINSIDYLLRGVTAMKQTRQGKTMNISLNVTASGITIDGGADANGSIVYSGDYPTLSTITSYGDEDDDDIDKKQAKKRKLFRSTKEEFQTKTEYRYGINHKYSEIFWHFSYADEKETTTYQAEGIYLLPIKRIYSYNTGSGTSTGEDISEYDAEGRLIKETRDGGNSTIYSNYKTDSQGNWIERTRGDTKETRTITYY